MNVFFFVFLR